MNDVIITDIAEPLVLDTPQQETLLEELDGFIPSLTEDGVARTAYMDLRRAVEEGQIPGHLQDHLENFLDIALRTGRSRRLHGPQAEQALLRVYNKTPRARAVRQALSDTNTALKALQGQEIASLNFTAEIPGVYRLVIDTDGCQIAVEINSDGVQVNNVEINV